MTPAALSPDRARHIANPAEVASKERKLLAILRDHPGETAAAIVKAANEPRSATLERLTRLAARGVVEKDAAGRWRIAGEDPRALDPGAEAVEPEPAEDAKLWVRSISHYVRIETSPFACARFG